MSWTEESSFLSEYSLQNQKYRFHVGLQRRSNTWKSSPKNKNRNKEVLFYQKIIFIEYNPLTFYPLGNKHY